MDKEIIAFLNAHGGTIYIDVDANDAKNDAKNDANNSTISSSNNSTIDSTIRLSETQAAILTLIKENKYITTTEISNKLNKVLSTIKKSIKVLKDAGILARIGTNRNGHWEIVEKGKED